MPSATAHRVLFDVDLEPVTGSRFQPTGFPDIGATIFDRPERVDGEIRWRKALLVESAQSMANRLEEVGWDRAEQRPVAAFDGLPYVRVVAADNGRYLTSSRTEAHRLSSAFIKDATLNGVGMRDVLRHRLGLVDDTPLVPRDIAGAVMALDSLCLVHGVFFAESAKVWPGQPRIARAFTGFIEAVDVHDVVSGGVKRDDVRHQVGEGGGASEGYGFVPFHRTEFTAGRIAASFCIDIAQIRAYALGEAASALLETITLWELRALLDGRLRLRTACDLVPVEAVIADRAGEPLPSLDELTSRLRRLVEECRELLGDGGPVEVEWLAPKKKGAKSASVDGEPEER